MNTTAESAAKKETWGPYQLRPNPMAILRLSIGTAGAISTALVIPDFFSLLPSAPNIQTLLIWETGLWGYAYVFWTAGFLGLLHLARIFGAAILLDDEGIKLGRFDKKILWKDVLALNIAERKIFSKLFFIPAFQMTIHYEKAKGKKASKQLASFQFTKDEFYSLFYFIAERSTGTRPGSIDAFIFKDINNNELKKIAEEGRLKRAALTGFIALGLICLLGRKAATNYEYNWGNKEFKQANYDKAIGYYTTANVIDITFAPAWDRLARCEYRLGDLDSAEQHWQEALKWKPDLVESKVGLSQIYMIRGQLDKAKELLRTAVRLAKYDEAAYINTAKLNSLTGNNRLAIKQLEEFIKQKRGREQAIGILADCYLLEGEIDKAERIFKENPAVLSNPYSRPFCTMIMAKLELAKGNTQEAVKLLGSVRSIMNSQPELLINNAQLEIARADFEAASKHLAMAEKLDNGSSWLALAKAHLAFKADKEKAGSSSQLCQGDGKKWISLALQNKYKDPCVFSAAAQILDQNSQHEEALRLAKRCLETDPNNLMAKRIVESSNDREKSGG